MNKEKRLLRVGVLGCGPISQIAHFDACHKARNAELHAICDQADDLLDRMALIHRPRAAYRRYEDMLSDPQVEAVLIGIADQFHVAAALDALAAGKHVLVEKPLGITIEECRRLQQKVRETGLTLQVGNNRRFDPGIRFAHDVVRARLGGLVAIKHWYCDSVHRYTMTDNLQPVVATSARARRPDGNPKADKRRYFLLTHGSHLVDTARFLGGAITRVRARLVHRHDCHCWFVSYETESGALGHLDLAIPICGDFSEGFQIYGERGSLTGRTYLPWYHKSSDVEFFSAEDRQFHRPLGEDAYTYKRQIEGFADTVLHGTPQAGATVDDGMAAVAALVAISRSVDTGEWVHTGDVSGGV